MTLPQAYDLFDYWRSSPPEHEILAMLARVYTTWEPEGLQPMSEAEAQIAHRKSLERRWAAGAMNVAQMFKATGGFVAHGGVAGTRQIGVMKQPPGIGPFPGMH